MRILIIANYTSLPGDNANSRFPYIAELLSQNPENQVELITSSFRHPDKKQRDIHLDIWDKLPYKITTIYEPGYMKNVSIKRFYSHWKLSKNLKIYLENMKEKPDVIYCAVPSLDLAKEAAGYAKKNNIRFIIDIQDLWPEAFKMVINIPILKDIIFLPWQMQANNIYKSANDIVAVSETYVNRATKVNKKYKNKLSVFLGTDLDYFDKCKEENKVEYNDDIIRLAYIGTLGHSYNIKVIIDALDVLKQKGYDNLEFVVMGSGPLKEEFEQYAKDKNVNCRFTGRLEYSKMVGELVACDIAVNPIAKGAAQSIINKVGDYASAGLPVINTQENNEYRGLVEEYNIGYNCSNDNITDIANKIELLILNKEERIQKGKNNRRLAEEKFDRKITYTKIVELIENKNITILHIGSISGNPSSGVSVVVPQHVEYQAKYQNVAFLNCSNYIPKEIEDITFLYSELKGKKLKNLKYPFNNPNLVVFHSFYIFDFIKIAKELRKIGIPYIIFPHGSLTKEAQKIKKIKKICGNIMFFNKFVKNSRAIQYLSENEKENTKFPKKESFIMGNGIKSYTKIKKEFNIDKTTLIYVGRISHYTKGLDLLVEACNQIKDFMRKNNISLDIFGPDINNSKVVLTEMINRYEINDIVTLNEGLYNDEKTDKILECDVFIQTSRHEGQPVGLMEALMLGLPCIVTEGTTFSNIVEENKCGIGVENTVESIAKGIVKFYENKDKWKEYSINAIKYAKDNFMWSNISERNVSLYKKIYREVK